MLKRTCLTAVLLLSSYCVSAAKPIDVPMPIAQDLAVELVESQQEIGVTVSPTAGAVGMQFGLVGALIGSAIQNAQAKKAETAVVPLRDLLVDYRFNQRMHDVLLPKLSSAGISPHPVVSVMPSAWDAFDAQQTASLPPQALVLRPSYAIDSAFALITVMLSAQLVDRTVKGSGKVKVVPSLTRSYAFRFPLQGARSANPVQDWTALGQDGLTRLLEQGIAQTTDMLVHDFSAEGRASWAGKHKRSSSLLVVTGPTASSAGQSGSAAWVRSGKGRDQSLDGSQPVSAETLRSLPSIPREHVAVRDAAASEPVAKAVPEPTAAITLSQATTVGSSALSATGARATSAPTAADTTARASATAVDMANGEAGQAAAAPNDAVDAEASPAAPGES